MALEDEKRENGESIAHWQQEAVSKGVRETRENVVGEEEFFA